MDKWDKKIIVAVSIIAFYLIAGTVFFHLVEGWRVVDSFYFTGVTLSTVGYGDFTPTHDISKVVAVFFAFSGIGVIFYSIGIIGQKYFEREEERLQKIWEGTRTNLQRREEEVKAARKTLVESVRRHKEEAAKVFKR